MSKRSALSLAFRNLLFVLILPAAGAVYGPWWVLTRNGIWPQPIFRPAAVLILIGIGLYLWCVWAFATAGAGTPAPWDAPRHLVAVGPYALVRNPIYVAAFLVIAGETWLFVSLPMLVYLSVLAVGVHLYVLVYEEPRLKRRFGEEYDAYVHAVPRWLPHRPANRPPL